jgi:hypothetical protein
MPPDEVGAVVGKLGGAIHAAAIANCAPNTIHRALDAGKVSSARVCCRLAMAIHPRNERAQVRLIRELAGLEDDPAGALEGPPDLDITACQVFGHLYTD